MRRNSVFALAFTLVILVALIPLTAGSLRPKTDDQIDGLKHFRSMEVITAKNIWSEDWENSSAWGESSSPGTIGKLTLNSSLAFSGNFSSTNSTNIAEIHRDVSLSLDDDPSLDITLSVSSRVGYGISFLGEYPNGTLFITENDGSYLQNRPGLGRIERISVNLMREAYLATGALPPASSTVTEIVFYLTTATDTRGDFSMSILDITAYSPQRLITSDWMTTANALGLIINLNSLPSNETLFQLIAGFYITGSSDLSYTLYFVDGYSVIVQGGVYRPKPLLTYEIVPLRVGLVSSAPPFYAKNGTWSLSVVAQQGVITFFQLDTLAFRYTLENLQVAGNLDPNLIRIALDIYLLLLFVIPIDTVVILKWLSKPEA